MERTRPPPEKVYKKGEKLLLETILEKSLGKYDLKLLEGEKRYWHDPAWSYGNTCYDSDEVCQKKTTEKALKLKIHPWSKSNIGYELIRIYNLKKEGNIPNDCVPAGKDIEVARFRAGGLEGSWARIRLWYFNESSSHIADLSMDGEFNNYLLDKLERAAIEYEKGDSSYCMGDNYSIKNEDLTFAVSACVKFVADKYKSYLNYARRQIELSDPSSKLL